VIVIVRLFASLREAVGRGALELELPEGARVGAALDRLRDEYPALERGLDQARVAVNYDYVGPDFQLRPGDELAVIPPVSGGAERWPPGRSSVPFCGATRTGARTGPVRAGGEGLWLPSRYR
jgi:molybdopterin converting factor subunit 1